MLEFVTQTKINKRSLFLQVNYFLDSSHIFDTHIKIQLNSNLCQKIQKSPHNFK